MLFSRPVCKHQEVCREVEVKKEGHAGMRTNWRIVVVSLLYHVVSGFCTDWMIALCCFGTLIAGSQEPTRAVTSLFVPGVERSNATFSPGPCGCQV